LLEKLSLRSIPKVLFLLQIWYIGIHKNQRMYFFNKIIWITGASSGIGKALAIKLSKQQCKLILSSRNTASLELVKQACDHPEHI